MGTPTLIDSYIEVCDIYGICATTATNLRADMRFGRCRKLLRSDIRFSLPSDWRAHFSIALSHKLGLSLFVAYIISQKSS